MFAVRSTLHCAVTESDYTLPLKHPLKKINVTTLNRLFLDANAILKPAHKSTWLCSLLGTLICLALLLESQTVNAKQERTAFMSRVIKVPDTFDVQGHRGARARLPENTLPAFLYALEIGVDTLELDLGVSQDGHVVILHDQVVNPDICQSAELTAAQAQQWVHQLSLTQLKSFDCGSKRDTNFPNQTAVPNTPIPTLAELFQAIADSSHPNATSVLFNIETKSNPANPQAQPQPADFVERVLKVVQEFALTERVTLQSFDHRTLVAAYQQAPEITRAALFRDAPADWIQAAQAAYADIISPRGNLISADSVAAMQAAGYRVIPWTANTVEQWLGLIHMGVDGIITDDPEPLLELLGRR